MMGIYLVGALLIGCALFLNRRRVLNYILVTVFVLLQWGLTIFAWLHRDKVVLVYFTPDALSVIFLSTLSVISVPAFWHSYIYFN